MKAVLADLLPPDDGWAFEIKWDGYRALVRVDARGGVVVQSSNGHDVTARYPELQGIATAVGARPTVLDGEIVALDERGLPSFHHLQVHDRPVTFVAFDVLLAGGTSVMAEPYEARRARLDELLTPGDHWLVSPWQRGDGRALAEATRTMGLEGIMAKRLGSPYLPGKRSTSWRKVKHRRRQELVIGGWTAGEGRRFGTIGALLVGYHPAQGDPRLTYAGAVGSGVDGRALDELVRALTPLRTDESPFAGPITRDARARWRKVTTAATWARPELVAEVSFAEWTPDGLLRQPVYHGLRDDKDPLTVVREEPM